jgi:Flp pilus assembly protein TadG
MVVPLLCVLVLVLVDFGKFMNYWLDLTHIANYGARLAAVDVDLTKAPYSSALSLQEFIRRQAETSELRGATVSICFPEGGSQAPGAAVKIQVAYDYNFVPFIGRTITVRSSATMRLEHQVENYGPVGTCS